MPLLASDIAKKNVAREIYMNKQMNYGAAGSQLGGATGFIPTNTAASVITTGSVGPLFIVPAELSTMKTNYSR